MLRRLTADADTVPDAELLARFLQTRDQASFELLVWRHGGLVWNVCRRMLAPDHASAEDACQATFLALATRAHRVREAEALPGWLHRVATRASLDLLASRRTSVPLLDQPDRHSGPAQTVVDREESSLFDAGVNRLPDRYRMPFVLCELEGKSNREAAALLDCPVGIIESRLTRAPHRLRTWLSERGVTPALAVPPSVQSAMLRAGMPGTIVETSVKALAARAVPTAVGMKLGATLVAGLLLAVTAAGFGLMPSGPPPAKPEQRAMMERVDGDGKALPAEAIARLGSSRLRHGSWVKDVAYSADGKLLASVGYDHTLRVWDAPTGKQRFAVRRDDGEFDRVAFLGKGQTVVAAGRDKAKKCDLTHVSIATGIVSKKIPLDLVASRPDVALRFSTDGTRLGVGPDSN
jgi:RNA polymerase sigma factor (sigma-70 family)